MEITALCLTLVMNALMLLVVQVQRGYYAQKSDAALLQVDPDSLQHFEYKSFSIICEGPDGSYGWRVLRRINEKTETCPTNSEWRNRCSCTIKTTYVSDSGKYWCENEEGERSNTVNIAVTAGSLILESPILPVMEGSDVTLHCKTKITSSNLTAYFYKDGFLFGNSSTGKMTIHSVSDSDEGLYKCSISDSGDSPESWLAVRALQKDSHPSLWVIVTIVLVGLLLAVGLLHLIKKRVQLSSQKQTPQSGSGEGAQTEEERQPFSREDSEVHPHMEMYAVVRKHRKHREPGSFSATGIPSVSTNQHFVNEDDFYSMVQ
ncbi:Fc receptor-like protein 5 isoform X2 [Myripristis murdjan]|uniref:Fc receptor-like protein 5 isoform X2 n=1 Tax=Myripristis murdjan TaxID=586833 RepID=UPI0011762C25|nr:Fc receptor-like protein 5 isoform X2 [Myripristis murdjan]